MVDERADRYPYARLADGLRADSALSYNAFPAYHNSTEPVAPYLRSIVRERGAFGVSHTHVPTESRPGHVALIGALYSIGHRRARLTRSFRWNVRGCLGCHQGDSFFRSSFKDGTDDRPRGGKRILWTSTRCSTSQAPPFLSGLLTSFRYSPMAPSPVGSTHGPTTRTTKTSRKVLVSQSLTNHARGHLLTFFKLVEASTLDTWVLEHLETLFQNATSDPSLDVQLRQEKTVFFMHLLGLDVTGHSHRPHSRVRTSPIHPTWLLGLTPSLGWLGIYGKHQSRG
jgi:phosphatidylinositol glycan class N